MGRFYDMRDGKRKCGARNGSYQGTALAVPKSVRNSGVLTPEPAPPPISSLRSALFAHMECAADRVRYAAALRRLKDVAALRHCKRSCAGESAFVFLRAEKILTIVR